MAPETQSPVPTDGTTSSRLPVLWLVVPCFNEEAVLSLTAPLFLREIRKNIESGKIADSSKICFVNDGSEDSTWSIIKDLSQSDPHYIGISLSRNKGHQNALLAGLMEARGACDMTISIDCDGQDDITAISKMIDEYLAGNEVVYGVRSNRKTDALMKRTTAEGFYKILNKMGAEVVFNHADYRLLGSKALDGLSKFGEVNVYLRGLVPMVGFPSSTVEYEREERVAGKSHYPISKMLGLAIDGVTSLSVKPIRFIAGLGMLFSLVGLVGIVWALATAFANHTIPGWASMICLICLFGGLQLLALGIIGEYVGKIYLETKHRPRYLISERTFEHEER